MAPPAAGGPPRGIPCIQDAQDRGGLRSASNPAWRELCLACQPEVCLCSSRRGEEGVKKFGCMVAGSCMVGAEEPRGPAASNLHRFRLLLDPGEDQFFVALLFPLVEYNSFEKEI